MTFRVGQKVVCVDDDAHGRYTPFPAGRDLEGLTRGSIYIIRYAGVRLDLPVVRLEEIIRKHCPHLDEENFYSAHRFRPIVERKTDISIFTKMLTPTGVDA